MTDFTDEQAIRAGVELAPGWRIKRSNVAPKIEIIVPPFLGENMHGSLLGWRLDNAHAGIIAALAADLVDMVDALLPDFAVNVSSSKTVVRGKGLSWTNAGEGRRLNTIHAVVAFYEAHPEAKP